MAAFLKMQLKIYFRLISTYVTPLIVAFFFIFVSGALTLTIDDKIKLEAILKSGFYYNNLATFGLFTTFMTTAFISQSILYKYRNEGVELITYSKPISRASIYFANFFASIIGILFSIFITSMGYMISRFITPNIEAKTVIYATLSYILASLLASLFILSIALIIQRLVELKTFQICTGFLPFIFVLILNFVSVPSQSENIKATNDAYKKIAIFLPNKIKKDNVNIGNNIIDNVQKQIENGTGFISANYDALSFFNNEKNKQKSLKQYVKHAHNTLYNKLFWLDYQEYYNPSFVLFKSALNSQYQFSYYQNIKTKTENGILNQKLLKDKYDIAIDDILNLKVIDLNKSEDNIVHYALSYSTQGIKNIDKNKETTNIFEAQDEMIKGRMSKLSKLFKNLKKINEYLINNLIETIEKNYTTMNLFLYQNLFKNEKDAVGKFIKILNLEEAKKYLQNKTISDFIDNEISNQLKSTKNNNSISSLLVKPKKPDTNASQNEIYKYHEKLKQYQKDQEEIKKVIKNFILLYQFVYVLNKKDIYVKKEDVKKIINNEIQAIENYNNNIVQFIPLENNLLIYGRKDPIPYYLSLVINLDIALVLIFLGLIIFIRKNYE